MPSSVSFRGHIIGDPGRAKWQPGAAGPLRVCGVFESSAGAKPDNNQIVGRLEVMEVYMKAVTN